MTGHVSAVEVRVRYAETDQMGIAHHANYLIWCELGRTDHMRELGVSYRELEGAGVRLPVVQANLRYRIPARYDDLLRIRSWVRECGSRKVEFGNAIDRADDDVLLATARITLISTSEDHVATKIPRDVRDRLVAAPDPVRM